MKEELKSGVLKTDFVPKQHGKTNVTFVLVSLLRNACPLSLPRLTPGGMNSKIMPLLCATSWNLLPIRPQLGILVSHWFVTCMLGFLSVHKRVSSLCFCFYTSVCTASSLSAPEFNTSDNTETSNLKGTAVICTYAPNNSSEYRSLGGTDRVVFSY